MSLTDEELRERFQREQAKDREDRQRLEDEKMADWARFCDEAHELVGEDIVNTRGDVYQVVAILKAPDPLVYGSGKYRAEYIGPNDTRHPCRRHMPLGIFETIGEPGPMDTSR